jgi:hypothetical protein
VVSEEAPNRREGQRWQRSLSNGRRQCLWPLLVSSSASVWTRRHPGHLGGGSAQFWVALVRAKKAEWGKRSVAPLDRAEREQGEGAQLGAPHGVEGEEGGSGSEAHEGRGGPGRWQDPGVAAPGRAARARAQSKQGRRKAKRVTNMWARGHSARRR